MCTDLKLLFDPKLSPNSKSWSPRPRLSRYASDARYFVQRAESVLATFDRFYTLTDAIGKLDAPFIAFCPRDEKNRAPRCIIPRECNQIEFR